MFPVQAPVRGESGLTEVHLDAEVTRPANTVVHVLQSHSLKFFFCPAL